MKITITDKGNGRRRVSQDFSDEKSMTEQSHRNKVNINKIIAKYKKTGLFPQRKDIPTYGDFSNATDYHTMLNKIQAANDDFMSLPSDLRSRFENDAGKLIEFMDNPDNVHDCIEMGLIPRPEDYVPPEPIEPPAGNNEPEPVPEPTA